ncbi:MAG TPA: biopolymer transporter ExbD [Gemmatirosa sp.]|nr:biopolymer transporter ExbD [Gemmatirosa sp.]
MSTGPGGGGLNADPNVTPMIDVLMVLLIIFMVIVPSSRKALDVQVPDPNPQPSEPQSKSESIVLTVNPGGQFLINKEAVNQANLASRLKQIYDPRPDKIIFIKGDPKARYQDVISAMDVARGAGVKVIGFTPKGA